jgi:transcriptional regulator with XRE-family HTH domain
METIGEKIKSLRKGKGLSLMDLANILGISDAGLLKTKSITVDLGKKTSKALGISFNELFDIEEDSTKLNEEIQKLKELVFESIGNYIANTSYFKLQELIERYGKEKWGELGGDEIMQNHSMLREFDKRFKETLINVGFCTLDEIINYDYKNRRHPEQDGKTQEELDEEIRETIKRPYVFDNETKEFIPKE